MKARLGCHCWVRGCQFAFWKHLPLSLGCRGAFKECLEGVSRGKGILESDHYDFGHSAPAWSFEAVTARFFKQCSARMIRWETVGLLVGHGGLLLGLRCDAWDARLHSEGIERGGFELPGDDAKCFILAAFQLV